MIEIWLESPNKVGQLGGPPLKNFRGQKHAKFPSIFCNVRIDREYLRNGLRYPNQKGTFSILIPPAFNETDPVNFGPLIPEI